jgi:hypothetical protein
VLPLCPPGCLLTSQTLQSDHSNESLCSSRNCYSVNITRAAQRGAAWRWQCRSCNVRPRAFCLAHRCACVRSSAAPRMPRAGLRFGWFQTPDLWFGNLGPATYGSATKSSATLVSATWVPCLSQIRLGAISRAVRKPTTNCRLAEPSHSRSFTY